MAMSEGPPSTAQPPRLVCFYPGGAAVWLEWGPGARGPGPPGTPLSPHRLWAPPPPASHQPLGAALCLLGSAGPLCPAWTLTRPAARQPPGEPRDGSLVVKLGSTSFASSRHPGLVLLAVYGPKTSLCIFSVCRLSREWGFVCH